MPNRIQQACAGLVVLLCPAAWAQSSGTNDKAELQPVKIGERNRYIEEYKLYNVSTNPLGYVFGSFGLSASYALNPRLAVRAGINLYSPPNIDVDGVELTVSTPLYMKKMYDGLYLEPVLTFRSVTEDGTNENADVFGPGFSVGHQWMWDGGYNVSLAFGMGRNFANRDDSVFSELNDFYFTGYLQFGYAF